MTNVNEQFEKFAELQQQFLAPLRTFNGVAAETFEKISRQNYALLGDYIEFAVGQARLPAQTETANDYIAKQVEASRNFGEQLYRRGQEYAEIVSAAAANAQTAAQSVTKQAA